MWERTDLSRVDPAVLVGLVDRVRGNLEDATNGDGESVHLGALRDGTVTYDSTDY